MLDETHLRALEAAITAAKAYAEGFGVSSDAELHAYELMSGKGAWKPIRNAHRAAFAIYKHAIAELDAVPTARMFIEGVDIPLLNKRYKYPYHPHRITLQHLLEAINEFAIREGERVVVIADEVQDQEAHRTRAENYQLVGTGGFKSSKLGRIDMPITFGSSARSPGLQASDLVIYLYRRIDAHTETDPRAAQSAKELWADLRPIWGNVRRWDP